MRREGIKRRAELVASLLVDEPPRGVEPLVRVADSNLRVDDTGACGRERLAELGLSPDAAVKAGARTDHDGRLSPQNPVAHRP